MSRPRATGAVALLAAAFLAGTVGIASGLPPLVVEPTDAQVRAEYDRARTNWLSRYAGESEFDVRHILLGSRNEADAVLKRISDGEKFEDLARVLSRDPASGIKGGGMGWSLPADFVEPFAEAMRKLAPAGRSTTPVQSPFGWHVIEVLAVREAVFPPFEQVKDRVRIALQRAGEKWQVYDASASYAREVDMASLQPRGDKVFFRYRERMTYGSAPPRPFPAIVAVVDCERRERSDVAADGSFEMRTVFPDTAQARQFKVVCDKMASGAAAPRTVVAPLPDVGLDCDSPKASFPPELDASTGFRSGTVVVRGELLAPAAAVGEVLIEAPSGYPALDAAAVKAFRSMKCATRTPLQEARWVRRTFSFQLDDVKK